MANNTNTQYEIGTEIVFNAEPTPLETARMAAIQGLQHVINAAKLETRMFVFDALHGTHYRQIRHVLVEEQRRKEFEQSIGLVAVGHKK